LESFGCLWQLAPEGTCIGFFALALMKICL